MLPIIKKKIYLILKHNMLNYLGLIGLIKIIYNDIKSYLKNNKYSIKNFLLLLIKIILKSLIYISSFIGFSIISYYHYDYTDIINVLINIYNNSLNNLVDSYNNIINYFNDIFNNIYSNKNNLDLNNINNIFKKAKY